MIYLIELVECGFGEDTAVLITLFQITLNKFLWWVSTRNAIFIFIDLANINGGCCLFCVGDVLGPGTTGCVTRVREARWMEEEENRCDSGWHFDSVNERQQMLHSYYNFFI